MKKNLLDGSFLSHFLKRYLLFIVLFFTIGVWGQTSITHTFSATSGTIDSNISFSTEKNTSGTAPAFSTNLRLYDSGATSPYKGCSITLTPSNGATITAVELYAVSGYTQTVRYTIGGATMVLGDPSMSLSGTTYSQSGLSVTNSLTMRNAATSSSSQLRLTGVKVTYTLPGITSAQSGPWSSTSTWVGGIVPTSADNVTIAAGHTVTITSASGASITRDNGTTTTVSPTATLATNIGYVNGTTATPTATTTINGTFQIGNGGYSTGKGFTYGIAGTLIFNHNNGSSYGVNDDAYWPTSAGPVNVLVYNNSPIKMNVARAVSGSFESSSNIENPGQITIGTSGTLKLNSGYNWSGTGSPLYGASSTLIYNSGGTPGRNNEWTASSGTVGTTAGYPANVQVSNNTTLNFPNGNNNSYGLAGNLTIDSGSILYQNYSGNNSPLAVGGNVVLNGTLSGTSSTLSIGGNLSLNGTLQLGGDTTLSGNWTQAALASFTANGKRVIFNGSAAQTIQKTGGGTIDFDYLTVQKSNTTNVSLSSVSGNLTNITINGTSGNALSIIGSGAGSLNLNANKLNLNNNGGFIYVDAAKAFVASSNATIEINGSKAVANNAGTGSLTFPQNLTINVNANGSVDFGKSSSYISTVNGILNLNATTATVSSNPPIYGSTSTLVYKSGATFGRGAEWSSSTTGSAGCPQAVQITNSTTLNYPNTPNADFATNLSIAGDLTIDASSSLYMDFDGNSGQYKRKGSLTVGKNVVANGNLSLGNAVGGDLFVAGAWSKGTGTFTPNGRQVTFNGSSDQSLTGATNFDYLKVDKSGGSVVLGTSSSITVSANLDFTNRTITLGANNITLSNTATVSNYGGNGYAYVGSSGGQLIRAGLANGQTFVFPIGFNSGLSAYAPITVTNTGSTSDIGVVGKAAVDNAVADSSSRVGVQWTVTSSVATTATLAPSWYSTVDNGVSSVTSGQLGNYVSAYTVYPATISSYSASASNVALSTSGNKIVVGKNEAIVLGNNTCSNAYSVTVDAAAISGTTVGASSEGTGVPSCSSVSVQRDVWYKFTVPAGSEGNYKIDVTNSLTDVVELRSGACTGTVVKCSATAGGVASVTAYLTAGTYYYRVLNDGSSDGTFTTSVSTSPTIVVSPSSLAFGTVPASSTQVKTFSLSGSFLKSASSSITVTAPNSGNEYQVSLDGSSWATSVNVPYTSATLAATTVYVKFRTDNVCGVSSGGNITFSAPLATSTPTIALTGSTAIDAPTANAATDNTATTFTAHWNAVTGATGYELDVSTSSTFGTDTAVSKTEEFESGLPSSGYTTNPTYSLTSGEWNFTDVARNTSTSSNYNSSTYGAQLKANTGIIISPSFNKMTSVSFYAARGTNAASISVYKIVNGVESQLGTAIALSTTPTLYSYTLNETSSDVKIKIVGGASFTVIDHFVVNYFNTTSSYVSGYNGLSVSGTSHVVSGLTSNTTYYYRVRAVSNACKSSNSSVITAVTNNTVVWNGTAWSNTDGPTAILDSKVIGNYNLSKSFETKDLEITSSGSIAITSNFDVTVNGAVTNNGTITVNSDANFVQKTGSTYSGAGTFTVLREAKVPSTQFNYWSSPIYGNASVGQNMYAIYPNIPANRVMTYNTANDRFVTVQNPTYGAPGIGYSIKGPTNNTSSSGVTATFTGTTPNNGDVSVTLNKAGQNYNLVGNPYPSNIDLNAFYNDNTAVLANGTFWLWDNTNNTELTQLGTTYTGNSYATWNASSGTGVKGTSTTNSPAKTPTRYATVAQGFIVEANPSANVSLVFRNSERVNNAGVFFASKTNTENDAYWLELLTPAGVINTQAVVYSADAVNTLDKFDSGLGILGSDSFYSFADGDTSELIIQGRTGDLNISDAVPLGAVSFSAGNHRIRLSDKTGIFQNGQKIYLHDKLLNQYHDLTTGDYSFNMNKGTVNNRFEIVYKDAAVLGNSDLTKSDFRIYRHHDHYVVESSKKLGKVELYDAGGRLVKAYQTDAAKLEVDMMLIPNGVYIIKAENSGDLKTKKIRK